MGTGETRVDQVSQALSLPHRLASVLLTIGFIACEGLLIGLAYDMRRCGTLFLILGLLGAAALVPIAISQTVASFRPSHPSPMLGLWQRVILLMAVPLGMLACALSCMGVDLHACHPICGFLTHVAIPLTAVLAAVSALVPRVTLRLALTGLCLVFLIPNCHCYNYVNARWIDLLGLSPVCFAPGVLASILAIWPLHTGRGFWSSIVAAYLIVAGSMSFFIGHHYFHFPW